MVLTVLVMASASFLAIRFLGTPAAVGDEPVVFEVKPGESFKTVARHLEEQGLISSAWKLELYVRITRSGPKVRVGEYALRRNFRPREIVAVLTSGKSIEYSITVPEGANRFEIGEILEKTRIVSRDEFLRLTADQTFIEDVLGKDVDSLEGYLFPETYHVTKYTGAKGFIYMLVARFRANYSKIQELPGWSRGALSERQLVTMASIIEKETMAPEERSVIASVFYNRLRIKMPLQTDPTIIYGIFLEKGSWGGSLPREELRRPGPYNSYLNLGLPPGPIGNPGAEALKAAGMPAKTDFLFFMSLNNGTHTFSREYSQHAKAVSKYWRERRSGSDKSWRDLQKRDVAPDHVVEAVKNKNTIERNSQIPKATPIPIQPKSIK